MQKKFSLYTFTKAKTHKFNLSRQFLVALPFITTSKCFLCQSSTLEYHASSPVLYKSIKNHSSACKIGWQYERSSQMFKSFLVLSCTVKFSFSSVKYCVQYNPAEQQQRSLYSTAYQSQCCTLLHTAQCSVLYCTQITSTLLSTVYVLQFCIVY